MSKKKKIPEYTDLSVYIEKFKNIHSDEFTETQTGPQEEPCLINYPYDLEKLKSTKKINLI